MLIRINTLSGCVLGPKQACIAKLPLLEEYSLGKNIGFGPAHNTSKATAPPVSIACKDVYSKR